MEYRKIEYKSWAEFVSSYTTDIYGSGKNFVPGKYIFRGQGDAAWKLVSSFDRRYRKLEWKKRSEIEKKLLDYFVTYCQRENIQFSKEDIIVKSLAQHYGIPTRMLDWSFSPFYAAYFAFHSCGYINSDAVAIWAMNKDHDIWKANLGASVCEVPIISENIHQRRQLGCFSIINNQETSLEDFLKSCEKTDNDIDGALIKIIIPSFEWKHALNELEAMGINATRIFGGLEGCAQAAKDIIGLNYD